MRPLLFLLLCVVNPLFGQQVADTSFRYRSGNAAYGAGAGPVILFDEFHNNPATLKGQYAAFTRVLSDDGYVLRRLREEVTAAALQTAKIYVSVNAMYDPMNWDLPARSAYSEQEVNALYQWVKSGGSLFLVTDHMPCPASVNSLARKFGFNLINGFAQRKDGKPEIFSRSRGNLHENVITNAAGRCDSIMLWGGTGFIAPREAAILTSLDDSYDVYLPVKVSEMNGTRSGTIPRISGMGLVNGAFMKFGKGRLVIFADAAPFSAQLEGINSIKRGMNHPDASQNAMFLLNIIHWLNGRL